jgi:hypothetical protein
MLYRTLLGSQKQKRIIVHIYIFFLKITVALDGNKEITVHLGTYK